MKTIRHGKYPKEMRFEKVDGQWYYNPYILETFNSQQLKDITEILDYLNKSDTPAQQPGEEGVR